MCRSSLGFLLLAFVVGYADAQVIKVHAKVIDKQVQIAAPASIFVTPGTDELYPELEAWVLDSLQEKGYERATSPQHADYVVRLSLKEKVFKPATARAPSTGHSASSGGRATMRGGGGTGPLSPGAGIVDVPIPPGAARQTTSTASRVVRGRRCLGTCQARQTLTLEVYSGDKAPGQIARNLLWKGSAKINAKEVTNAEVESNVSFLATAVCERFGESAKQRVKLDAQ